MLTGRLVDGSLEIMYPVLFRIGSWDVRSALVLTILGLLLGLWVGRREARRVGFTDGAIFSFFLLAVPVALGLGFVNGFLFRLVRHWGFIGLDDFFSGGLVSFGAVLGALLTGWVVARLRRQSAAESLDVVALVLPLILGVYRIGCLLNGCCYGVETDGILGVWLPGPFGEWASRYPTQGMYLLLDFSLFGYLYLRRRHRPYPGSQALAFLFLFGLARFFLDAFRDLPPILGALNFHQLAALAILAAAGGGYLWRWRSAAA